MSTRRLIFIVAVSANFFLVSMSGLLAQEDATTETQLFTDQYSKTLAQIQEIPTYAKRLEDEMKKDPSPQNIQEFRSKLADALSATADNGSLETVTKSYRAKIESSLKNLQDDEHFTPEQRRDLITRWTAKLESLKSAMKNMDAARAEIREELSYVQTEEDYFYELMKLQQADKILDMIGEFTNNLNNLSVKLKNIKLVAPTS